MSKDLWPLFYFGVYFLCFVAAVAGICLGLVKRRREKPPLEFKLIRGPGESLRRRMDKFSDDFLILIGGAAMVPVIASLIVLAALIWISPQMRLSYGLAIVAAVSIPVLYLSGNWAVRRLLRNRNDSLGYLGERVVGEALLPLHGHGYRVFHDVPMEVKKKKFNVDHVAIGPQGIFAIETKTRRKGRARPGFEAHKVAYDGKQLIWPWTEDTFGLEQSDSRARALGDWLNKMTGLNLNPQPVLVLPGWFVVPKGLGPIVVVNHKQVVGAITRETRRVLTDQQIDLISRQLDVVCRDVED
jgi:hypothetical protein